MLAEILRLVRTKRGRVALVFLLVGGLVWAFVTSFAERKAQQLAGPESHEPSAVTVESTGDLSPNIVGNSGGVDVRIQVPAPEAKSDGEIH